METRERFSGAATARRRRNVTRRLGAVAAAVTAAVAVWAVIEVVAGIDLRAPAFDGSARGSDIGLGAVVVTSTIASLGAWALLAVLERWARRPKMIWTVLAALGFVVSLSGPMSGTGIEAAGRWLLALLHVTVASVLIPLMSGTAEDVRPERGAS